MKDCEIKREVRCAPDAAEEKRERRLRAYWVIELETDENTLLALAPIKRMVPTTITRTTANITAYSATSWPRSSNQN